MPGQRFNMKMYQHMNIAFTDKSTILLDQSLNHKLNRIIEQQQFREAHWSSFEELTDREIEVMTLLVQGMNNPMIAEQLYISRHTVEQHRKNLNRKLSISSFSDLFQFALAFDLL